MGKTGSRRRVYWSVAALLLVGLLAQACSDNKGPAGPTFPAGQTGHADFPDQIVVNLAVNPNTVAIDRPVGITVVVTNTNGRYLPGKRVQMSTTLGTLDPVDGFTNEGGQFITFLRVTGQNLVTATAPVATVTAFVEGASNSTTVNFAQLALTITPNTFAFGNVARVGGICTGKAQFTVTGGQPPYTFTTNPGPAPGNVTFSSSASGGTYTFTANGAGTFTDTVVVTDAQGKVATATVTVTCTGGSSP